MFVVFVILRLSILVFGDLGFHIWGFLLCGAASLFLSDECRFTSIMLFFAFLFSFFMVDYGEKRQLCSLLCSFSVIMLALMLLFYC